VQGFFTTKEEEKKARLTIAAARLHYLETTTFDEMSRFPLCKSLGSSIRFYEA
jgi:hypothetical protein